MIERDKKVVAVGMSGGVNSTMAALILAASGISVVIPKMLWYEV